MTPPPPLVDANGRPVPLDRQLGSGGEGAVFTLSNDPSHVGKVYHRPPTPQTVEKLTAMVGLATPQLLSLAAWPKGLVYHARTRQVAGFVMPRLGDCQPIQHLYNPVQRLKCFPRAGWNFQVRAAVNLAAAFDEVHKAGCLMGDVNQSNEMVSPQALVRLIDCDSFQVRANGKNYLCDVGTPHYTPPELQGKPLRGLVRTENHDRFGLAVLIYQLLFVGRHPYAGVYRGSGDPPFDQLIAEFRFAQGPLARTWGMDPPPHTPTFADAPPDVGTLFRRAFERGSEGGSRPRPGEWLAALKLLESQITECSDDSGHRYWRGTKACTWCRLARNGGPEFYFGVSGGADTFAVDEAKLQEVLRRLDAAEPIKFRYSYERFAPAATPRPEPLPDDLHEHRATATVLGVAIGACVSAMPFGLLRGFICVIGFLGSLVFGVWLVILLSRSPWHRERRRRRDAYEDARRHLHELETEWEQIVQRYRRSDSEVSDAVRRLVGECRGLAAEYQGELRRLTAGAEAAARLRHLRLHLIADADIPRIGAGRKQTLAAYNICTAADIDERVIRNIKGFGDALTGSLLGWRETVLRQFRFDPTTAVPPAEQRSTAVRFRAHQQEMLVKLDRHLLRLESLAPACRAEVQMLVPELQSAAVEYERTKANFTVFPRN